MVKTKAIEKENKKKINKKWRKIFAMSESRGTELPTRIFIK